MWKDDCPMTFTKQPLLHVTKPTVTTRCLTEMETRSWCGQRCRCWCGQRCRCWRGQRCRCWNNQQVLQAVWHEIIGYRMKNCRMQHTAVTWQKLRDSTLKQHGTIHSVNKHCTVINRRSPFMQRTCRFSCTKTQHRLPVIECNGKQDKIHKIRGCS